MEWNLHLEDTRTINKFNDTLHTSFVKHDIYQKVHYLHNWAIYPLPEHLSRAFELFYDFITHIIYAADKNVEGKPHAVWNGHRNTRKQWI